jgi:NitT/TauT family transport system substrate-binding protein
VKRQARPGAAGDPRNKNNARETNAVAVKPKEDSMKTRQLMSIAAALVAAALVGGTPALAADLDYGKPGTPVQLVVGYQPYYTESWSGVVMRGKKFYEKYLPAGSTVEFQIGLQGAIIVNNMLAGKQHIGYMGDMPSIVSTTKESVADVRLVAAVGLGQDMCNIFLARKDAPDFKSPQEGLKWLSGKQVATAKGACSDRFAQAVFKAQGVEPKDYLNQNIEVMTSNFRAGKIDAAIIWEPTASRLVEDGLAKRIASGVTVNESDAAFLAMRADLITQRPDIVKAWLNAELDAELFLADEKNADEVTALIKAQTTGFSDRALWRSLYAQYPALEGGTKTRLTLPFAFTPEANALLAKATEFLFTIKSINAPKLRPEAVMTQFTEDILKERKLKAPVGDVETLPDAKAPK